KQPLEIQRLLAPQRPIVVEDSDAIARGHKVPPAFLCYLSDEIDDGLLRRALVPRGQRISGLCQRRWEQQRRRCQDERVKNETHGILLADWFHLLVSLLRHHFVEVEAGGLLAVSSAAPSRAQQARAAHVTALGVSCCSP